LPVSQGTALPKPETPADAATASATLVETVARGELTPGEAGETSKLIERFTRAVDLHQIQQRLVRLEATAAKCPEAC
jgi:hypothetical protein